MAENDDAQTQHRQTQAQLQAIENEIKSTQPLTSTLLPIEVLVRQYTTATNKNNNTSTSTVNNNNNDENGHNEQQGFLRSASFLSKKYNSLRKIRGDGNCYYRAFLYSLCEHLLRSLVVGNGDDSSNNENNNNDDGDDPLREFNRLKKFVSQSLKWVCQYGFDEYTIDMFHEELVELFDFIEDVSKKSKEGKDDSNDDSNDDDDDGKEFLENALKQLHSRLNEENACSDYCTWFMRVITSAQMKSNPNHYLPFLMAENYGDVPTFCAREVEPMGKECGMVQVSALAECFGVRVVIEYMDGRGMTDGKEEKVVHHVFGEGGDGGGGGNDDDAAAASGGGDGGDRTTVTLLYRPGHYDILY